MPLWWNWQTRTTQNRVPQGMTVRLRPAAPFAQGCNIIRSFMDGIQWPQGTNNPQPGNTNPNPYQPARPEPAPVDRPEPGWVQQPAPEIQSESETASNPFVQFVSPPQEDTIPAAQPADATPYLFEEPGPLVDPYEQPAPSSAPVTQESSFVPTADETEKVSYADSAIQEIEIARVVANPYQPRKIFKPEALQELASSIKEHGVIQPIVVTETPSGYEIVVGERRFRASQLAGLVKIPAIVKKTLHDQTKLEVALIENIQRQELNAIEEAQAYDRLIKVFKMTQDQVAKKVGKSRPAVANTLRLLNLPAEIQRGVIEGRISEGHARAILGLPDIEKQILKYQTIIDQGLNVRQVEAKVRELAIKRRMDAATPDPKLMAIESELRGKLGAQVKIQRQGRGGKIMIEFFSDEDLEEILNRMADEKKDDGNYLVV